HFLFTLIALYAARVHIKHHHLAPFAFAFIATLPDIDHFFGMVTRGTLHNIFITVLFPLLFILLAFKFERYNTIWKKAAILLFLVLVGHVVLDFFTGNSVLFFYPVSDQPVNLNDFAYWVTIDGQTYPVVSPDSVGVLIYTFILAGAFFLDELIDIQARTHRGFKYAFGRIVEQVKSWLREP
ncbi:MAG: metal-dependent hydrolase, partial [Candidatus Aenigmarchaeota archaeon]|nr:metal-dependent hydrolase [Candidatus Aenigmarchaeota archaeon]